SAGTNTGSLTFMAAASALSAGTYNRSAILTAAGASNSPRTINVSLTIQPPPLTVTWTNPAAIVYGIALGAAQLNASASVPGSFGYVPPAGTVLNAGNGQLLSA